MMLPHATAGTLGLGVQALQSTSVYTLPHLLQRVNWCSGQRFLSSNNDTCALLGECQLEKATLPPACFERTHVLHHFRRTLLGRNSWLPQPVSSSHQQLRNCRWWAQQSEHGSQPAVGIIKATERSIDVRMESQVIFDSCWRRFEERFSIQDVNVPREIVWLNGAPGAGKGVNTVHILKTRGLDTSISLSQLLLSHRDVKSAIDRGDMIPDTLVGDLLLEALLVQSCKHPGCGVLVDGFPRTSHQVDFLKLLYDKLVTLYGMWVGTPREQQFPRPLFKVVMLYVDEETSIKRQMERAKQAFMHNKRVMDAGAGELWEQRATDMSVEKCKKRYDIFKTHYGHTLRLKEMFPFHLIDAMGTLDETREAISMELRYQSSLDLSAATYARLRHLPLSRDLAQHARQKLVSRLNDHSLKYPQLFQQVTDIITKEVMPLLQENGMSGRVEYVSEAQVFQDNTRAAQMLIDVLTDRGFHASHATQVTHVPIKFDLQTGDIKHRQDVLHKFLIYWETKNVRDIAKAIDMAMRIAETSNKDGAPRISQSFIPWEENDGSSSKAKAIHRTGQLNLPQQQQQKQQQQQQSQQQSSVKVVIPLVSEEEQQARAGHGS